METSSAKRVVAGALFALFVAFIVAALAVFGVISMALGHIFMVCAFAVGVLIIWTELIPAKPARHKIAFTVALLSVMLAADFAIIKLKQGGKGYPLGAMWYWWSGPHGRWFDRAIGGIATLVLLFFLLLVAALGKVISARRPRAAKG